MPSKYSEETHIMNTKSHNVEIIIGSKTDNNIKGIFFAKIQEGLEESAKGSEFVFDTVNLLHYHLQKINLNRGGSSVDSPK